LSSLCFPSSLALVSILIEVSFKFVPMFHAMFSNPCGSLIPYLSTTGKRVYRLKAARVFDLGVIALTLPPADFPFPLGMGSSRLYPSFQPPGRFSFLPFFAYRCPPIVLLPLLHPPFSRKLLPRISCPSPPAPVIAGIPSSLSRTVSKLGNSKSPFPLSLVSFTYPLPQ